jgi:hypothetical protein
MKYRVLVLLLCVACAESVRAEIYKSVDAEGHVTYSSTPGKGAKKLGLEPLTLPARPAHSSSSHASRERNVSSPADFPKVDSSTQKYRDGARHKILSDELAAEEKLLADARISLKQDNSVGAGGKLRGLQEEVTLHEKNVSALKTELIHLK